jgi:hypothetical protein
MNSLNPNAVNIWIFGSAVGAYFDNIALGLAIASGVTLLATFFDK